MCERRFTVGGQYRPGWPGIGVMAEPLPCLQITGRILEETGFHIGSRVLVSVAEPGQLVLTVVEEEARGFGYGAHTRS